jgi:hypothetical protein
MTMPSPDPLGYAVPVWLFQALSYLTLTLHLLAMNFTVGACILLLWSHFRNKPGHAGVKHFFGSSLPLGLSYVITLGIPPLLFVQVLYGQLFYSSSILIGAFWIQVIPALMIAYAAFYYHKLQRERKPRFQWTVVGGALILMLYVGYIYVNNLTLAMSPEKWLGIYGSNPGGGILHHSEPTLHSRYLLFLAGSLAAAGIALLWRGAYLAKWGFKEQGDQSRRMGFRTLLISPVLWIIAAIGVYFTRPDEIKEMFTLGSTTVLFAIGIASALIAIAFASMSVKRSAILFPLLSSIGMVGAMASMVIFRDTVRIQYLAPHFDLASVPINAQWGMLGIFLVALVVGLALIIVLMLKVLPRIAEGAKERLAESTT